MKAKIIIPLILVIALGIGGFVWWKKSKKEEVIYTPVELTKGNVEVSILATGTVQPKNRLEIKAPIAGRIETVLIKEGQKVNKGQLLAWMSSTERAALLDAARAQGAEELKKWEDIYRPTPVIAPIPGTIILRNVESGQTFTNTDAIFVMSDKLTVKAQVDETDIGSIKLGQKGLIILDAYSGRKIPAHVDQIAFDSTVVNNVTTYLVDVIPEEIPAEMRSGMTANVSFYVDERKDVLIIPNDAIDYKTGEPTVWVKDANGVMQEKKLDLGLSNGKLSEVKSGFQAGDTIYIKDTFKAGDDKKNSNPFMPSRPRGGGRGRR